jgi:hypothetical protein
MAMIITQSLACSLRSVWNGSSTYGVFNQADKRTVVKGKLQNVLYAEPEILVSARISTFRA